MFFFSWVVIVLVVFFICGVVFFFSICNGGFLGGFVDDVCVLIGFFNCF